MPKKKLKKPDAPAPLQSGIDPARDDAKDETRYSMRLPRGEDVFVGPMRTAEVEKLSEKLRKDYVEGTAAMRWKEPPEKRQIGTSTRLLDSYVQQLFAEGKVAIRDHSSTEAAQRNLFNRFMRRMHSEHPHVLKDVTTDPVSFIVVLRRPMPEPPPKERYVAAIGDSMRKAMDEALGSKPARDKAVIELLCDFAHWLRKGQHVPVEHFDPVTGDAFIHVTPVASVTPELFRVSRRDFQLVNEKVASGISYVRTTAPSLWERPAGKTPGASSPFDMHSMVTMRTIAVRTTVGELKWGDRFLVEENSENADGSLDVEYKGNWYHIGARDFVYV